MAKYCKRKNNFVLSLFITFSLIGLNVSYGQSASYKLQGLYIYSFAKYISWEKDTTKFVIGVVGESDIIEELEIGAKGRMIGGKPVEIQVFDNLSKAHLCHIVYLPKNYTKVFPYLLLILQSKATLVITEDDLAKDGAGVSFFLMDNRLRFRINQKVLERAGLKVSKGLLDLAVII